MLDSPNGDSWFKIVLGTITTLVLAAFAAIRAVVRRDGTKVNDDSKDLLREMQDDIVRLETQVEMLMDLRDKLDHVAGDVEHIKGKLNS